MSSDRAARLTMRVMRPVSPSLRPVLLFLQLALLVGMAAAMSGPARADDCGTVAFSCVHEVMTINGSSRVLSVTVYLTSEFPDLYNVIVPGRPQMEMKVGGTFRVGVQPDGTATYSVQPCSRNLTSSNCMSWTQVTRHFAPVGICQSYQGAAVNAINQSDSLGCGFGGAGRWDHNAQAHLDACLNFMGDWQGFVNNETGLRANDLAACKTRVAAASKPAKPIKTTGKAAVGGSGSTASAASASTGAGGGRLLVCRFDASMDPGPGKTTPDGGELLNFRAAAQGANAALPGPGECAWEDRPVAAKEPKRLGLSGPMLKQTYTGSIFKVHVNVMSVAGFIYATGTIEVLPPEGAGVAGGEAGGDSGGDMGGAPPPMQQAGGSCGAPGTMATVVINQPGLDKLNVRTGPGGQVIGTVPEGGTVSVIGPCGAIGGAGFAKSTTKPGGDAGGWCQISAPVAGCIAAQFLQFGSADAGTVLPNGAAGFAKSKVEPQASASAMAGFGGSWSANADNVAYSIALNQKGSSVSGSYQGADGSAGRITGNVSGNVLRFAWVQKDGTKGSGKFVLSDDGQSFAGSYNFGNNPDAVEGNWNGMRQ